MKKVCNSCKEEKNEEEFEKRTDCSTRFNTCRSCRREVRANSVTREKKQSNQLKENRKLADIWNKANGLSAV